MKQKPIPTAAIFHHSCRRKNRHASRGKAEAAARALNRRDDSPGKHEAYFCACCRGWHVGKALKN